MDLNLTLISYGFKDKPLKIIHSDPRELRIKQVRIMREGDEFNQDILYIGTWDEVRHMNELPSQMLCVGGTEPACAYIGALNISALVIMEKMDLIEVFTMVQDIFRHYDILEGKLMEGVFAEKPIGQLLDACADFFKGPILVFDHFFDLIASSEKYPFSAEDQIWRESVYGRHVSPNVIALKKDMLPLMTTAQMPLLFDFQGEMNNFIFLNAFKDSKRVVSLVVCESQQKLEQTDVGIAKHLTDILLSNLIKNSRHNKLPEDHITSQMSKLLHGQEVDRLRTNLYLKNIGWAENDGYVVLNVRFSVNDLLNGTVEHTQNRLQSFLDDSITIAMEESSNAIIVKLPTDPKAPYETEKFDNLLFELGVDCGISPIFHDFFEMNSLYKFASAALETGVSIESNKHMFYYPHYLFANLKQCIEKQYDLRYLCHDGVLKLYEHDKSSSTSLMNTLKIYLLKERNLVKTAAELHIHRNTLIYRIEKVKDILDNNLDDDTSRMHILLSCFMMEQNFKSAEENEDGEKNK